MTTDWIVAAVAGTTADGREITAEHLEAMAAAYNPDFYEARISFEHFFGGFGRVTEARFGPHPSLPETQALSVKLAPNAQLLSVLEEKRKQHLSIEYYPKFPPTGEPYLAGIAITDTPASTGTQRMEFSTQAETVSSAEQPLEFSRPEPRPEPDHTWMRRLFGRKSEAPNPIEPDEDTMTEEQLKQLTEQVSTAMSAAVAEALSAQQDATPAEPETEPSWASEVKERLATLEAGQAKLDQFLREPEAPASPDVSGDGDNVKPVW